MSAATTRAERGTKTRRRHRRLLAAHVALEVDVKTVGGRIVGTCEIAGEALRVGHSGRAGMLELLRESVREKLEAALADADPAGFASACRRWNVVLEGDMADPDDWWLCDPTIDVHLTVHER